MDEFVETHAQLFCGFSKSHKCVPSLDAVFVASSETDVALSDSLPSAQFGRVVVKGDIGIFENQEQALFFRFGFGNSFI